MNRKYIASFALILTGGIFALALLRPVQAQPATRIESNSGQKTELISRVRISEQATKLGFDVKKLQSIDRKITHKK